MRVFVSLLCITAISACAQQPEKIAAAPMEDSTYARLSCKSLAEKELQQTQLLNALSADQKKAATGDAWGVFLLGLPISSMSGSDKETEIAITKGRLDAIDRQQSAKGCR